MNKKYVLGGATLVGLYLMSQKPAPKPRNNYLTLTVPEEAPTDRTVDDDSGGNVLGNWRNNL